MKQVIGFILWVFAFLFVGYSPPNKFEAPKILLQEPLQVAFKENTKFAKEKALQVPIVLLVTKRSFGFARNSKVRSSCTYKT
jgi:hypothetical protein